MCQGKGVHFLLQSIAGFAAIVLALSLRRSSLEPGLSFLIRGMIINSLGVVALALFPWVLASAPVSEIQVWRWSSGLYVFGVLLIIIPFYIPEYRAFARDLDAGLSRAFVGLWSLAAIALVVHLANLSGWPFEPSFSAFYLGLWLALGVNGNVFIVLVYRLLR